MAAELFTGMEHPSLSDRIYQLVKERIIRHELQAGSRLMEQDIADNLGVSRTPVREAIGRLTAEGLVEAVPRRGVFVAAPSVSDIKDLYEVREALEVLATRLAIPLLTDEDISALEQSLSDFQTALEDGEFLASFELDKAFHEKLVELSGNKKLVEMSRLIGGSIQVTRWIHCKDLQRHEVSLRDHRMIMDALVRRDAETACSLVRDHIARVKKDLLTNEQESV